MNIKTALAWLPLVSVALLGTSAFAVVQDNVNDNKEKIEKIETVTESIDVMNYRLKELDYKLEKVLDKLEGN